MAAVLKPIAASLDGEFLVMAQCGDHHLTATESGIANALFVARQLAATGWSVRVQGQEARNQSHDYTFDPYGA